MSQAAQANEDIFNQLMSYFGSCDFLKYSALPTVLLISAFSGLKTWLWVEMVLSLIGGVVLLVCPKALLELQMKGPIDSYHLFLCSLLGCYVIYSALFPIFVRNSKDDSILNSHFWNRIISSNLMFVAMAFSYLDGVRWNYTLLCVSGGPVLVTMLVNAYFLKNSTNIRSQSHQNLPANTVAKFEFFMLLSAGLVLFAFPDQGMLELKNPNDSHRLLCRLSGILLFSLSFESFTMPSFLFEKDKYNFLLARLTGSLLELAVILLGYYYYKVIRTNQSLAILLFVNVSYNVLIISGILSLQSRLRDFRKKAEENYQSASANNSLNASTSSDKKSS